MAIVKMQRVTVATLAKEGEALLRRLQDIGVLHPEPVEAVGENDVVEHLEHELHVQRQVIHALESEKQRHDELPCPTVSKETPFASVEGWLAERRTLEERIARITAAIRRQAIFGSFEPQEVARLAERGVQIQLWEQDEGAVEQDALPDGAVVRELSREGKRRFFATAVGGERIAIEGATEVALPERSLISLEEERATFAREADELARRIRCAALQLPRFRHEHEQLTKEYDFRVALAGAFDDEAVAAFAGWIPVDELPEVRGKLARFWAPVVVEERDALPDEEPPVKTRNTWIARMFEPLLHLLGRPDYRGIDPALFFAPFMMLFFGICLGDAGYGLMLLAASWVMRRHFLARVSGMRFVANMTLLFGIATTIWGLVTGSIFGIVFKERDWIPLDVSSDGGDPMLLFKISIGLGVIHLSIALLMACFAAHHWHRRFERLGVLAVMWGGVFGLLHVPYWWIVLGAGLALILFFSSNARNPFARIGLGLWGIYGLTGLLGDVMSYARLFGLGIATGAIASVVNMLAGQVREAVPVAGIVLAILVLLVGHAFNLTMGIISALVHPARLHAVEAFPKCVELTGRPYEPLSR